MSNWSLKNAFCFSVLDLFRFCRCFEYLFCGGAGALDIAATLRLLMPSQTSWIADILLIAVIMSTIDTFVMPLLSGLQRTRLSLFQLRLTVLVLFAIVGILAWLLGDILQNIIAAFSALVAFLPAVFVTFFLRPISPNYISSSLSIGVLATVFYCFVDVNLASFIGLLVSSTIILFGWTATRVKSPA
jgi:hypothetical protein